VLIVDDERGIRDFLCSAFQAEGYTALVAGDGEAALQVCDAYLPDVILLDLMMPRLDGLGFLHEFRRRHGLDVCPIIIMSAVSTAVEHAEAAGVTGAVVKPFDLEDLIAMVEGALGPHRAQWGQRPA
jgi:two-component system chemotaxis response regulator CheY